MGPSHDLAEGEAVKTYWDLSDAERVALTDEELGRYEAIELAEAGVPDVTPPQLEPQPPAEAPTMVTRYLIAHESRRWGSRLQLDILFPSAEAARAAIDCGMSVVERDYNSGLEHEDSLFNPTVVSAEVCTHMSYLRIRDAAIAVKTVRERNGKAEREYEAACEARTKALSRLRDDRSRCLAEKRKHDEVQETWRRYVDLADGEETVALRFLAKAYPAELLAECGFEVATNG